MSSDTESEVRADPPRPADEEEKAPARRRFRWWMPVLALIGVVAIAGSLLLVTAFGVRQDLEEGRAAMERGRDALADGDTDEAEASFHLARARFDSARAHAGNPVVGAVGWLPIIGRSADAVRAISESGVWTAEAAIAIADSTSEIPGGLLGLAPSDGAVPIERIDPVAAAAAEADLLVQRALARVASAPDSLLLGPLGEARRTAEEELSELSDTVHAASSVLGGLPAFLGQDGPRRYFFGAQNPAELRGTGGLIGAYSILTVTEGNFHFSPFVPIHGLATTPLRALPPPNEDYTRNYEYFRRNGRFWTAINVMPDLPSVAQAILSSYREATGDSLDGVILADPFALEALMGSTGPLMLPGYDVEIDAENVVAFTTNEAFALLTDPAARKRILGDVAKAAFELFISQPSADDADLRSLLETAADRHIQVYSTDPQMQEGLAATPVGGTLTPPRAEGDLVSVIVTSAAGSKVDFYQERLIAHTVTLNDDGSADATLDLTLRNHAPTSGLPAYVLGPYQPAKGDGRVGAILRSLEAGDSVPLVNVYCGSDCVPGTAVRDGAEVDLGVREDLGVRYVQDYFLVPSGESVHLRVPWDNLQGWEGNSSGGTYRATIVDQITIRPTRYEIRIEPPDGMTISSVGPGFEVVDGAAVFEGTIGSRLDIDIEFAPSLVTGWWRNVTRLFTGR